MVSMATTGPIAQNTRAKIYSTFRFFFSPLLCSNLKSSGRTTALSTILARWTGNCFITPHMSTDLTVSHWKAQNKTWEEQVCHELWSPSAHLFLILLVKRMIQSHADPVMWRGWINCTSNQVSLDLSSHSHELLISTTDGHPHRFQGIIISRCFLAST